MILPGNFTLRTLFWFMVIFLFVEKSLGTTDEGKKFNIKLGFDLTQGANGAPSIKIRPFNGTEFRPRASEGSLSAEKTSASGEEPAPEKEPVTLKFDSSKESSGKSSSESGAEQNRFTQAGAYEPEGHNEGSAASESEGNRRKRSVKNNKNKRMKKPMKKKIGNKLKSARKLGVSKPYKP